MARVKRVKRKIKTQRERDRKRRYIGEKGRERWYQSKESKCIKRKEEE